MAYTTIKKPSDYFNTKLYTGTGATQSITGVGFQPDWVWIKQRDTIRFHYIFDSIRGATKKLHSNSTDAESTLSTTLTSFDSDGYTVETDAGVNQSSGTYASWNWLASNTTASNTNGSITSTVSANTTSGFSIVSFTGNGTAGATVGHGLGKKPDIIIEKNRVTTGGYNWNVYSSALGATYIGSLNGTSSFTTAGATIYWNDTEPTSNVFYLGSSGQSNTNGAGYIAYCFTSIKGFSKFGSYTGNGSTDGTFVYTGFKPAWVMIKRTDSAQQWGIMDNKRNTFNPMNAPLFAEDFQAESSSAFNNFDILSNGMKMKTGDQWTNASGGTYIYMAFAEEPLVGDNPATAR